MAKKWTNENLPGALHYVTGNVNGRRPIFRSDTNCIAFLEELRAVIRRRESKLVCFVLMPNHFHLITNPRDGDIQGWTGELKSFSAKKLVELMPDRFFEKEDGENQVWQEKLQSDCVVEWMDDLAENKLHS